MYQSISVSRGGSRIKKGGGHNTVFVSGPPPASKVAQVPKKLISGRGGGGEGLRHLTHFGVPTHFFFIFGGGAHVQKGGGQF